MAERFRCRFRTRSVADPRPVTWPPLGPWWHTGTRADNLWATIVYVFDADDESDARTILGAFWPDAFEVEIERQTASPFTDRFPCPEYWDAEAWRFRDQLAGGTDGR